MEHTSNSNLFQAILLTIRYPKCEDGVHMTDPYLYSICRSSCMCFVVLRLRIVLRRPRPVFNDKAQNNTVHDYNIGICGNTRWPTLHVYMMMICGCFRCPKHASLTYAFWGVSGGEARWPIAAGHKPVVEKKTHDCSTVTTNLWVAI